MDSWLQEAAERAEGLTLQRLAAEVGVSPSLLSGALRGKRVSRRVVLGLAKALSLPEDEILARSGYAPGWLLKAIRERPELLGQIKAALRRKTGGP